jgi:hypothetical protein
MMQAMQTTIKCDNQVFVIDGISKKAECCDILSMLWVRLGFKMPVNENSRFLTMCQLESIEDSRFQMLTLKYNDQIFVLDGISIKTRCCELLSLIEIRLGTKLPKISNLNNYGRYLSLDETIEEV